MGWIKFDKDLVDDPRILSAAEMLSDRYTVSQESVRGQDFSAGHDLDEKDQLAIMRNAVTGALLTLWVYADTHIRAGDVLPISPLAVDRMVGIDGFCDLIGHDWVKETEDGYGVILPGYCAKNGLISKEKRRASNAERQRKHRENRNAYRNGVTNASSNAVTNTNVTLPDLDLDLDKKNKPNPPDGGSTVWDFGKSILAEQGLSTKAAGALIGSWLRDWPEPVVADALRSAAGKANVRSYVIAILKDKPKKGESGKFVI